MTTSPFIIAFAIITLFSIIIMILDFIIPEPKLSKGIIVNKHTEPEQKINHVLIVGEVPIWYSEIIPAKYYLDIRGYGEASPPKLCLDGASVVGFRGFSFIPTTDFLLLPYDLSLSF